MFVLTDQAVRNKILILCFSLLQLAHLAGRMFYLLTLHCTVMWFCVCDILCEYYANILHGIISTASSEVHDPIRI